MRDPYFDFFQPVGFFFSSPLILLFPFSFPWRLTVFLRLWMKRENNNSIGFNHITDAGSNQFDLCNGAFGVVVGKGR